MGSSASGGNLWLVPVSLLSSVLVYLLLKRVLVRWVCRNLLGRQANTSSGDKGTADGEKILTEKDLGELSLLLLTWLMGAATTVVSILAMLETMHDTLYARSTFLYPWLHVVAPYYLVDTYAMTAAYMKREGVARRRLRTKLVLFLRDKWPYLLHHVFIAIGYPVIVNDNLRGYKGDFYAAALLCQDLSNPLLANAKILNILGLTNNLFYNINGALLIAAFLLSRVLFVPITVSIYAAQYHHWDVPRALTNMRWICHLCNFLQFSLQLFWFVQLLRLATGVVRSWITSDHDVFRTERTTGQLHVQHSKKM